MWQRAQSWLEHRLFGAGSEAPGPAGEALRVLRYPYAVLRDLSLGELNLRAMGLVYATLLSLVPLIAFSFALLKGFGAHRALEPVIFEFFYPLGDAAGPLTSRIMEFADGVSGGVLGIVGFALLLWTLIGTIKKVEDSFNFVWHVEQARSFGRRVSEYALLLIVGPLLLAAFIGLTHQTLASEPVQRMTQLPLVSRLFEDAKDLGPYAMVSGIFVLLYMVVPNTRVRFLHALIGGVAAGVLWATVGRLFTAFVIYTSRLTIVYAGFAVIVAALLWTYLGWLILLVGAQLSFYVQNPNYLRIGSSRLRISNVEQERLALRVMFLVGRAHGRGEPAWSVARLADAMALPGIVVANAVHGLEDAGLLLTTDADDLVPARDTGRITVEDILDAARRDRPGVLAPKPMNLPELDRLTARLDESWRESCGRTTLRDLVEGQAPA